MPRSGMTIARLCAIVVPLRGSCWFLLATGGFRCTPPPAIRVAPLCGGLSDDSRHTARSLLRRNGNAPGRRSTLELASPLRLQYGSGCSTVLAGALTYPAASFLSPEKGSRVISMKPLSHATLDLLWFDQAARETHLRELVMEQLAEKPAPQADDHVVATYFWPCAALGSMRRARKLPTMPPAA